MMSPAVSGFRALLLSVVAVACVPGERPPEVPLHGTLGPSAEAKGAARPRPFSVVFAAPRGKAATGSEISVVFSEPARKLGVAGTDPPPPISMAPPIRGKWHWVGSNAV